MSKRKTHIRDIRLANNAGMNFPVCQAGAPLLDTDKGRWPTVDPKLATCAHCLRMWQKRYPWASKAAMTTYIERQSGERKSTADITHWARGISSTMLSARLEDLAADDVSTSSAIGFKTAAILFDGVLYFCDRGTP